jgi:CRISPR associated protein, Cas1 family
MPTSSPFDEALSTHEHIECFDWQQCDGTQRNQTELNSEGGRLYFSIAELNGTTRNAAPIFCKPQVTLLPSAARHAVDSANVILNYAYAVLEGQTRQALSAAGFDLACGFLHADRRGRDALVYDLMEVARPVVDDRVLTFLQATAFHAGDFTRVSDGSCRLHPQLARAVVAACGVPQRRLDEFGTWLASLLRE